MYPEIEDDKDIISALESCLIKLGNIGEFSYPSLVDLSNLDQILKELGLEPSKRQVKDNLNSITILGIELYNVKYQKSMQFKSVFICLIRFLT